MSQTFHELVTSYFENLDFYTRAITRAHGKNHPEAFEVREVFKAIQGKIHAEKEGNPDLTTEFTQLRNLTDSYIIPNDVCETYAATYQMLAELDEAYQD